MQQRLAMAQALAMEPPVLLLDEPFGALDPGTRTSMQNLLKTLWGEAGMTVVMVTHDLQEAFSLGTRLLVLDKVREGRRHADAAFTYDLPLKGLDGPDDVATDALVARCRHRTTGANAAPRLQALEIRAGASSTRRSRTRRDDPTGAKTS